MGSRRGRGEGTIFRLPDGRWRAQIDLGSSSGRRVRKSTTRGRRRDAAEWLRDMQTAAEHGAIPTRSITLDEWYDRYLREVAQPRVKPSTLANYRRDYKRHIAPALGTRRVDKLSPAELSRLYDIKLAEGLSPTTVLLLHATLRRALSVALRWGIAQRNVAILVDPPSKAPHRVNPLNVEEAKAFLAVASGTRLEARWGVALSLGLRQGEALGLWWSDIDLVAGQLHVVRQLARPRERGETLTFSPLKTDHSTRAIQLPSSLVESLRRHQRLQAAEIAVNPDWADRRLVFATPHGTPIDPRNDARTFKALLTKAGIREIRLHDLRHTAATLLLVQHVHPRVVMELLGHSQIGLTMNTYSHVMPALLSAAAASMEQTLWSTEVQE